MVSSVKVLVTGAGALLGQGIIRSLQGSVLNPTIIAVDPSPLSVGLYWADEAHLVPLATSPDYLPAIERLLRSVKPDAVLIGTDVELGIFAEHRGRLEREYQTKIVVSDPKVVAIADDKWLTYLFLKENGFAYPASRLAENADELIDEVGFPLVVKPRVGARSIGVHIVHSAEEMRAVLRPGENQIVQECVSTMEEEYTAGALVFDGECRASIVMRRHLRDGNTYRAFVDDYPEYNAEVRRMAEALRPYGPVNFQFRVDGDRVKVFEINGRFSGTTPLRAHAGFNEVEMVLRHAFDGEPIRQPQVERQTILRYWSETVVPTDRLLPSDAGE